MKLNKKLEIGINAVRVLKTKTDATKTADLAVEVGTTVNFLEQIMRNLKNAGIVDVKRGPGGGYMLNTSKNVTAYDVAKAVGRDFGSLSFGSEEPADRLRKSIVDAFLATTI